MAQPDILVLIPTYNECENVEKISALILNLGLDLNILFVDDASPDGTGKILDRLSKADSRISVMHRKGKNGIGGAHLAGIDRAYGLGYRILVTMDCDFTHDPARIPALIEALEGVDIAIGSRYLQQGSLSEWNILRRCLTLFAHFLTRSLLGIRQDASGGFRAYNLEKIPLAVFKIVTARSYSFFFESLFIMVQSGFKIREIPIHLSARTYGNSKMSLCEAARSFRFLVALCLGSFSCPEQFRVGRIQVQVKEGLVDLQNWDPYWNKKGTASSLMYQVIAAIYRKMVIRRNLYFFIRQNFPKGSRLLHAGCGSGQVDRDLHSEMEITALDISVPALRQYAVNNPEVKRLEHGSILELPFPEESFDGVYNLGVMEHFERDEIVKIFKQFHRALKPDGQLVVFWPHRCATSVLVIKVIHFFLNQILKRGQSLHPPEVSLMRSSAMARELLNLGGFELVEYHFGVRDFWVQTVLIAKKK